MTRRQSQGLSRPAGGIGNGHKHLGKPTGTGSTAHPTSGHLLCSRLRNLPGWREVPKSIPGAHPWCAEKCTRKSCGHVQLQLKPF